MSSNENSFNYQKQTTEILVSEGKDKEKPNYLVDFSGESNNYCVGFVDIANSTQISVKLTQEKMSKYYEIFLN